MKVAGKQVKMFKMKNRKGYAAICCGCLTEGKTTNQAFERMEKAMRRFASWILPMYPLNVEFLKSI